MRNAFEDKEIWFLTGSQDLYGEETLVQVADQSKGLVAALNDSGNIPVKVVGKETLKDTKAIRRAMLDATADDNVVGVITWMHTFSPAKMWINGLNALRKPLLHFHTQANVDLPWDTIDFDFMNLNQSAHGDREHAYILSRMGIVRETVVGHVSDQAVTTRIGTWARACVGWNVIQNMNVVRFGDNMRNVADTDGDKTEATRRMGVHITPWSTNHLVDEVNAVSDQVAEALAAEYEELYQVAAELRKGGDRHGSLVDAARQEIGLRKFLEDQDAEAFTTNFEDLGGLKQLPGLAVQRLMAEGYGFGPEGDWKTAILVRAVKAMSEGLPGGTALMEDYTYSLTPGAELLLGAHMLEICPTLTSQKPRLEVHPLDIGGKEDPVRMVFSADPGPAIVVSMVDLGPRFRLTANKINMVEPPAQMPNLPVAHAVWKPEPSLAVSAECWLESGGSHHTVLTSQVGLDVFRTFADLAKTELAVIDSDTTPWQFRDHLRWNEAFYRMAHAR